MLRGVTSLKEKLAIRTQWEGQQMIFEKDFVFIEFYVTVFSLLLQINDELCDIAVPWKNQMEAWHCK